MQGLLPACPSAGSPPAQLRCPRPPRECSDVLKQSKPEHPQLRVHCYVLRVPTSTVVRVPTSLYEYRLHVLTVMERYGTDLFPAGTSTV
eukprot:scaffold66446_cov40-Prasinocladus_malaysianus.AAC.2